MGEHKIIEEEEFKWFKVSWFNVDIPDSMEIKSVALVEDLDNNEEYRLSPRFQINAEANDLCRAAEDFKNKNSNILENEDCKKSKYDLYVSYRFDKVSLIIWQR